MKTNYKIIILILISIIVNSATAQTQYPQGMLSLKWGDSINDVKSIMLERKDVRFNESESSEDQLIFLGGFLSNKPVLAWYFSFYSDQLCQIIVFFKENDQATIDLQYKGLVQTLKEKYGEPNDELDTNAFWLIEDNNNSYRIYVYKLNPEGEQQKFALFYENSNLMDRFNKYQEFKAQNWNSDEL